MLITCMSVSFLNAAPAPIECIPTREKMDKPAKPSLKVTQFLIHKHWREGFPTTTVTQVQFLDLASQWVEFVLFVHVVGSHPHSKSFFLGPSGFPPSIKTYTPNSIIQPKHSGQEESPPGMSTAKLS